MNQTTIYVDADIILDERIAPDENPNRQNTRQQNRQSMQEIAFKASCNAHGLNTKAFSGTNLRIPIRLMAAH